MSNERQFEKLGGSLESKPWEVKATSNNGFAFDPKNKEFNTLEGYFVEEVDMPAKNGGKPYKIYKIHEVLPDGSMGDVFGIINDKVLDDRMEAAAVGSYIRIEYLGRTRLKSTPPTAPISQTNSYHNWEVSIDRNAIPYNTASGKNLPAATVSNGTANTTLTGNASVAPANNAAAPTQSRSRYSTSPATPMQTGNAAAIEESDLPF